MKVTSNYVFFWGSELSNFYEDDKNSRILFDNNSFRSSEQLFMYLKAKTFNDVDSMNLILKAKSPKDAKKLGRLVKNFDEDIWDKERENCMMTAITLKSQYFKKFKDSLTNPKFFGKTFVEASPYDIIWGIGLDENDPLVNNSSNWKGKNLLGKLLTKLRDNLISPQNLTNNK